ncbi:MAG: methylenetetrahydrofolate reductase, partial [Lachnospiraceae bacterium]|nr:methylenetetrahydrofolate reductase [Lachnospiraceae bacterium]
MHISQMFYKKDFLASFEIFPPKNDFNISSAIPVMDELSKLEPDFISVTCGAGGTMQSDNTIDLCTYLKSNLNIEPVAHMTCLTLTKEQVKQRLELLKARNIKNVLALRGDRPLESQPANDYTYAKELIGEVYSEGFCVAGACYP